MKSDWATVALLSGTSRCPRLERDAYPNVAARLKDSSDDLKRAVQDLGRSTPAKKGPGRAEQKFAGLAALFALR